MYRLFLIGVTSFTVTFVTLPSWIHRVKEAVQLVKAGINRMLRILSLWILQVNKPRGFGQD
jgi:hypothetical protein